MPNSILVSDTGQGVYQVKRKRDKVRPVSARWKFVLSLHLSGAKAEEIRSITGYSLVSISKILNHPGVVFLRQQIMSDLDKEFEAQYRKVVAAVDSSLEPGKPDVIKLQGAKLWGDYHKKFQKVEVNQTLNVTAEDVVFQIMNGTFKEEV
jgi:hypothetical protein